jgi:hypothetical protein
MRQPQVFRIAQVFVLSALYMLAIPVCGLADESHRAPRTAFENFSGRLSNPTDAFFRGKRKEVVDLGRATVPAEKKSKAAPQPVELSQTPESVAPKHQPALSDQEVLGNVDTNAPKEFKGIVLALRRGDMAGAAEAADLFVDYMVNLMWEVKQITKLIGGALLRRGLIKEENWNGVEQYLDYELAQARKSMATPVKTTHRESLKRVKPDPQHKAEVYYFFTLSCSYCRYMAADVERLYRAVAKDDDRVKMVGLTLRNTPNDWVESYRQHTGLTIPMAEGVHVADALDVAFVPTFVVVSPTTHKAYRRSGQMTFDHMYEFVRTVQGLPTEQTALTKKLKKMPISVAEQYDGATLAEVKTGKLEHRRRLRPSSGTLRVQLDNLKRRNN